MVAQSRLKEILDPAKLDLPASPRVLEIRYAPYVDSTGDEALEITVVLPDSTTSAQRGWRRVRPIEERIQGALQDHGIDLWPYFWFRTKKELQRESRGR